MGAGWYATSDAWARCRARPAESGSSYAWPSSQWSQRMARPRRAQGDISQTTTTGSMPLVLNACTPGSGTACGSGDAAAVAPRAGMQPSGARVLLHSPALSRNARNGMSQPGGSRPGTGRAGAAHGAGVRQISARLGAVAARRPAAAVFAALAAGLFGLNSPVGVTAVELGQRHKLQHRVEQRMDIGQGLALGHELRGSGGGGGGSGAGGGGGTDVGGFTQRPGKGLPFLPAMRAPTSGSTLESCGQLCEADAKCTSFVFQNGSCILHDQRLAELDSAIERGKSGESVYIRNELPVASAESLRKKQFLGKIAARYHIEATDPDVVELYDALDADNGIPPSTIRWLLEWVGLIAGVAAVLYCCCKYVPDNVKSKVWMLTGLKRAPQYTPQELASMWDDDDGL